MAQLVANCPRCGAGRITFDVSQAFATREMHGWQLWYEAFSVCRNCNRSTVFVLSERHDSNYKKTHQNGLLNLPDSLNNYVTVEHYISASDRDPVAPPEHIPNAIREVFKEGAKCMAIGCNNAAGTMFRLCVDLATRPLLPQGEIQGLNPKVRRDLGLRVPWLIDSGLLPKELKELSMCIREDGNDGAHAGTLKKEDAEDLLDFTQALLERMFTEPERLRLAQERRSARRAEKDQRK